jgi:hypothetical protein
MYDSTLAVDMERDLSRIISNVSTRGLSVILKDLPEIAKVLETSLNSGRLERSCLPFMGGHKHYSPIPRLFKGLWLRLFDVDGCLKQDIDPVFIFFLEQLCCLGKKFEVDPPESALYETTKEFLDVDEALPPSSIDWSYGSYAFRAGSDVSVVQRYNDAKDQHDLFGSVNSADAQLLDTIQRVADVVSTDMGEFIPPVGSRHGRGAVYEGLRGLEKFSRDLAWPSRLAQTFPQEGFFFPVGTIGNIDTGTIPSKLLAVPKTIKGPRLIAKEPTAHMYAQLSVMDWIYSVLPHKVAGVSIDFLDQTKSGDLALHGSVTGSLGTIDLKSASDRISLWLVERLFRRNASLLRAMADCRTELIDLSIDKKLPSLHRLRKFTTQGSALTFPIQSIVFFIITMGVMMNGSKVINRRTIRKMAKKVRIFGDDIIAPADRVEEIIAALEMLYLKVNTTKTHYRGNFRESCGVRAYKGVDVTPSYVPALITRQSKPADFIRAIEISNNFSKKWLMNLASAITSTVPKHITNVVCWSKKSDRSVVLHSFSGTSHPRDAKSRWNERYQREEVLAIVKQTKPHRLKLDGSLLLDAFLAMKETKPYLPSFEGVDDWYPLSRWEARDVVSRAWVPLLTSS